MPPFKRKKSPKGGGRKQLHPQNFFKESREIEKSISGPDIEEFLDAAIKNPLDAFLKLFSAKLTDEILLQTKVYAGQRVRSYNFTISMEELLNFLGILI